MCLDKARIIPIVCSAAEFTFPNGVFITAIPFAFAAITSILSTPTPALPIILILTAESIIFFVTFTPDRTSIAS